MTERELLIKEFTDLFQRRNLYRQNKIEGKQKLDECLKLLNDQDSYPDCERYLKILKSTLEKEINKCTCCGKEINGLETYRIGEEEYVCKDCFESKSKGMEGYTE